MDGYCTLVPSDSRKPELGNYLVEFVHSFLMQPILLLVVLLLLLLHDGTARRKRDVINTKSNLYQVGRIYHLFPTRIRLACYGDFSIFSQ